MPAPLAAPDGNTQEEPCRIRYFKYDGIQDPPDIADCLEALRDGFARGALSLAQGEEQLVLCPQGMISLQVEAKRKGEDCKLKFTLRWKERAADAPAAEAPLRIKPLDPDDA